MEIEKDKAKCTKCYWKGKNQGILKAKNPFNPSELIQGCPQCRSVDTIIDVCDEPNCWLNISCGTPTKEGYRSTCGKHAPY